MNVAKRVIFDMQDVVFICNIRSKKPWLVRAFNMYYLFLMMMRL